MVKETAMQDKNHENDMKRFQSPLGEVVKETWQRRILLKLGYLFQSPLGEVVKETRFGAAPAAVNAQVSIPSRGSGKGDNLFIS